MATATDSESNGTTEARSKPPFLRRVRIRGSKSIAFCDVTLEPLTIFTDVFIRAIRGWELGRSLDQGLPLSALGQTVRRGRPGTHHSDQDVPYSADVARLVAAGAAISMAAVCALEENRRTGTSRG